jgi:hypothetical protein
MDPANIDPSRMREASSRYAHQQEAYEAMVQAGAVSPTGELERLASAAGQVSAVQPEIPELTMLTGTHVRWQRGYFVRPEKDLRRPRGISAAPSLGPEELRLASTNKIRTLLAANTGVAEQTAGMALTAAIEDTLAMDREINFVRARQGELLGG